MSEWAQVINLDGSDKLDQSGLTQYVSWQRLARDYLARELRDAEVIDQIVVDERGLQLRIRTVPL